MVSLLCGLAHLVYVDVVTHVVCITLLLLLFYFPFSYVFIVCIVVNDVRTPVFAVK